MTEFKVGDQVVAGPDKSVIGEVIFVARDSLFPYTVRWGTSQSFYNHYDGRYLRASLDMGDAPSPVTNVEMRQIIDDLQMTLDTCNKRLILVEGQKFALSQMIGEKNAWIATNGTTVASLTAQVEALTEKVEDGKAWEGMAEALYRAVIGLYNATDPSRGHIDFPYADDFFCAARKRVGDLLAAPAPERHLRSMGEFYYFLRHIDEAKGADDWHAIARNLRDERDTAVTALAASIGRERALRGLLTQVRAEIGEERAMIHNAKMQIDGQVAAQRLTMVKISDHLGSLPPLPVSSEKMDENG